MEKNLVIGLGEVGSAIQNILGCSGYDKTFSPEYSDGHFPILHICFPWSETFEQDVLNYKEHYLADLVVVHSSVPIDTCDKHGWVHSPVRGVHPNLEKGIRTFKKYVGGARAREVANMFSEKHISCVILSEARIAEALKLLDTTQYGAMILLEKEIFDFCKDNNLPFDTVYLNANQSYNEGYTQLGMNHVVRPHLMHFSGKIGGHCVVENAALLDMPTAKRIIEENKKL